MYASTLRAPHGVKQKYFADLQDVLDRIPQSDILIMLGDINARFSRGEPGSDRNAWETWHGRQESGW